jgi:post-segregation antitoxin (ccd killing protein)
MACFQPKNAGQLSQSLDACIRTDVRTQKNRRWKHESEQPLTSMETLADPVAPFVKEGLIRENVDQ